VGSILIAIPHGGDQIPPEVAGKINITQEDIFYDGDALAQDLYDFKPRVAALVSMPIARAILDVNRAPDEVPPENPDGVIKTTTLQGKSVYKRGAFPSDGITAILLKNYYFPYHNKIASLLKQHTIQLALDCHTMLEYAPPTSSDPGYARPLVCLSNGGDEKGEPTKRGSPVTCPPKLIQTLAESFRYVFANKGAVTINKPFAGGYTSRYHHRMSGVPWIQIELNRKLYLAAPYLDAKRLFVDKKRISELREMIFSAIERFFEKRESPLFG
jgi:formiminoglutamase